MTEFGPTFRQAARVRPLPLHEVIEAARIVALDSYAVLDTPETAAFDFLVRRIAGDCGTPVAVIGVIDRTRQWFKARLGIEVQDFARHATLCHTTLMSTAGCLVVQDAAADRRFAQLPLVLGAPFVRAYAGAVLLDRDGYRLGTIAAMHPDPGHLSADALPLLQGLAREVMTVLEAHRAALDHTAGPGPSGPGLMLIQGWLGVRTEPSSGQSDVAAAPGIRLTSIAQDSPAAHAGLRIGDVLLTVGGVGIRRSRDIVSALADRPEGSQTVVEFSRDGARQVGTIPIEPVPPNRISKRRPPDRLRW